MTLFQLKSFCTDAGTFVLDMLFPLRCLGCDAKNVWICTACLHGIPIHTEQRCPTCLHRITPFGQTCFDCRDATSPMLDGLFAASPYHDSLLPYAIHTFKYRFIPGLSAPLGDFLTEVVQRSALPLPDLIIPVPLHRRRLRFRGFNQSELLARELSQSLTPGLEIPLMSDILLRIRHTKPQMKTESREERLANLKNAFAMAEGKKETIRGKYIWLVDDVATTGTTLEECAAVLKQHGAKRVFGVVLAQ
jgi:ComF family protein